MPSNNLSIVFTTSAEKLPRKNFVTRNKPTSRITRNGSARKYLLIYQQVDLIFSLPRKDYIDHRDGPLRRCRTLKFLGRRFRVR
jgi:hypothetical protein